MSGDTGICRCITDGLSADSHDCTLHNSWVFINLFIFQRAIVLLVAFKWDLNTSFCSTSCDNIWWYVNKKYLNLLFLLWTVDGGISKFPAIACWYLSHWRKPCAIAPCEQLSCRHEYLFVLLFCCCSDESLLGVCVWIYWLSWVSIWCHVLPCRIFASFFQAYSFLIIISVHLSHFLFYFEGSLVLS